MKIGKLNGLVLSVAGLIAAAVFFATSGSRADVEYDVVERELACSLAGTWSCSAEGDWLRTVLRKAGYGDVGPGTGSALVIPSPRTYVSSTTSEAPPSLDAYSLDEALSRLMEKDVYVERGGVRLAWRTQGRTIWVEPPPDRKFLATLVRLTELTRAPK